MRIFVALVALSFALISAATQFPDAPTGFDNKSNGMVDDATVLSRMPSKSCIGLGVAGHGIARRPSGAGWTLSHSRDLNRPRH